MREAGAKAQLTESIERALEDLNVVPDAVQAMSEYLPLVSSVPDAIAVSIKKLLQVAVTFLELALKEPIAAVSVGKCQHASSILFALEASF